MKKRIFLFTLVLSILMCVFAISAFAANITVDHINYTTSGTKAYFNADIPTDGEITELVIPEKITYDGVEYTVVGTTRADGNWPTDDAVINSVISVTFPATVTSIDSHTFRQYKGIKYVEFKGEITTFNNAEFYECSALEEIKFAYPDSVVNLHQYNFYGCEKLATISPLNNLVKIGSNAFRKVPATFITDFSDVTTIGEWAFCDSGITGEFHIPKLTSISSHSFRECHNLTGIRLGGTFTALYNACFYNCYSLEYVAMPSTVATLDQHVFAKCSALEYVIIPEALTSASTTNLFQSCNNLKSILYTGNDATKLTSLSVFANDATAPFASYDQANPPATRTIFYGTPVCAGCGDIDTSEFSFDFISFTEKMYDRKACDKCGYVDKTAGIVEYAPILVIKGYTVEEGTNGSSMAYGFTIDKDSLAKYQNETGITLSYGLIVGSTDGNTDGKIVDKDGNSLLNSAIAAELSGASLEKFTIYNIKLTDIKTDNQKSLPIFLCAYVISGEKVVYLGEDEKDFAVAISYNDINK